jgi:hypothetical protein
MKTLLLASMLIMTTTIAHAQSIFDATRSGTVCKQNPEGSLHCTYNVGNDLIFSITAVGELDSGISFLKSDIKGDYYARFGVKHGCVIIARGESSPKSKKSPIDYAFVSPKNGRVYRTWEECKEAK